MYLASHPKSSLENIQPDTYTDVIVMVGINNVKRPGLKEWKDKKVSDKLVIQSYRLTITWSRLVNNEQHILYVKIGKLVNSFANYSYCYYFR